MTLGPIIVVGIGRSGTSLVQSMLASHSLISFPPETGFFRKYVLSDALGRAVRNSGIEEAQDLLRADSQFARTGLDGDAILAEIVARKLPDIDCAFYREFLGAYAKKSGKHIAGDKDPRLIEYLRSVRKCIPNARVLNVQRDPRDILASKKKADWSKSRDPRIHIAVNRIQWTLGTRFGTSLFGSAFKTIKYEDLLANPERQLTDICEWIGVEFDANMLTYAESARSLVSKEELQWKKETFGPLLKGNAGKWRSSLTLEETELTERVNAPLMRGGNYESAEQDNNQTVYHRVRIAATSWIIAAAASVYVALRILRGG